MPSLSRRNVLQAGVVCAIPPGIMTLLAECGPTKAIAAQPASSIIDPHTANAPTSDAPTAGEAMKIQYLEIVTPEADAFCDQYAKLHKVKFGEPDANLGNARTAKLDNGGMIGIRKPMHAGEKPVVRPYVLVEDIKATVESVAAAGAKVAVPPMKLPGHGTCAIYFFGGIECGLWQND